MKHLGWRKPTPGLGIAQQHAQAGERLTVPKNRALLACKRVAAHIGLKASDIMLLDTLGAFTQPQDWQAGRRPLVWASNAYLMEQTGFSLSALKRHARRLVDAGVIAFRDSPNGKRWGHRDADGHIIEAYGYDLAPMAARTDEFETLYLALRTERQLCARLKRQITITRRTIRAKLETRFETAISNLRNALIEDFHTLLERLPKRLVGSEWLIGLLQQFVALHDKIDIMIPQDDQAVEEPLDNFATTATVPSTNIKKLNPNGAISEPHIQYTNQLESVVCISLESRPGIGQTPATTIPKPIGADSGDRNTTARRAPRLAPDLKTVMQACQDFTKMAQDLGSYVRNWEELHRLAGQVRPMIGVTEHAWSTAQTALGPQVAAAAMALIFDKFSKGEITSPGGYLHGMIRKAGAGELHLENSFYGRMNRKAA